MRQLQFLPLLLVFENFSVDKKLHFLFAKAVLEKIKRLRLGEHTNSFAGCLLLLWKYGRIDRTGIPENTPDITIY